MKRIAVIGSSGAGKSELSRRLGEKLGLPVIHLDKIYWQPGWTEPDKEQWRRRVDEIVTGDRWIIDGNFGGTMEVRVAAADTVIFLDLPRSLCLWRVVKRWATYKRGSRPDMADDCHEKFDFTFWKWVWDFPRRSRPKVIAILEKCGSDKTVIRLRTTTEIEDFLHRLQASERTAQERKAAKI